MHAERKFETASADALNEGTDALQLDQLERSSVSVAGVFVGTVELQRRLDGVNWRKVKEYTAPAEETYEADERCELRLIVTAYTSGTAELRVGKG